MAAAYAALVSIMQIIDQLQQHPRPPIFLDKQQAKSLIENATSLQEFLEGYSNHVGYSKEADPLEMRIADAAHAAEDVIESHIVDRILADGEEISSVEFDEVLQKVIEEMEIVKKEVMVVKEKMGVRQFHQLQGDSSISSASTRSASPGKKKTMVGQDDVLLKILDKLTGQESSRQIITITGMGGIGKTTLATNVYHHPLVVQHFDFRAMLTISQQYETKKVFLRVLELEGENSSQVNEIGCMLHKKLSGRRYLIVIDDIWNIQVWDELRLFLPDNNNGSRIMITTRLSNLAREIDADSYNIEMDFLDEDNSWKLFCKHVFGEEDCPLELKGIGMEIVAGCKGLPLSISVIGGLLAKSPRAQQHWEHVSENINSIVNLEDDQHCLQVLYMSYNSLPIHLKPCFLYMGVFGEDDNFPNVLIVAFWIAEGFVKPIFGKSLEEAANEYLFELDERNLIFLHNKDKVEDWMKKECHIHDLLRDLCIRESQKQNFYCVVGDRSLDIPHHIDTIRRICIAENAPEAEAIPFLESATLARSLWLETIDETSLSSISSRLLRVTSLIEETYILQDIVQQVNLRMINLQLRYQYIIPFFRYQYRIPSSISRFWNLQSLTVLCESTVMAPCEIWMMPQLRSITVGGLYLPDPPSDCSTVLENLHTLAKVHNFKCSEEVVKRIPNIKILQICYTEVKGSCIADYCINNLGNLQQLELLQVEVNFRTLNLAITFPLSLKSLMLFGTTLRWDDMTTTIGSLPLLEYLCLDQDSCVGSKWETMEGQFCSLRLLKICGCGDLENWMTENYHFPQLKKLVLQDLHKLDEIPSCLGDIPTLELIKVKYCSNEINDSAERIKQEQEEIGNEDLQVQVVSHRVVDYGFVWRNILKIMFDLLRLISFWRSS